MCVVSGVDVHVCVQCDFVFLFHKTMWILHVQLAAWTGRGKGKEGRDITSVILQYYAMNYLHIHLLTKQPLLAERVSCPPGDDVNGSLSPADSSLLWTACRQAVPRAPENGRGGGNERVVKEKGGERRGQCSRYLLLPSHSVVVVRYFLYSFPPPPPLFPFSLSPSTFSLPHHLWR